MAQQYCTLAEAHDRFFHGRNDSYDTLGTVHSKSGSLGWVIEKYFKRPLRRYAVDLSKKCRHCLFQTLNIHDYAKPF